jgi:Spy/CpxP family protein refolding chaperone
MSHRHLHARALALAVLVGAVAPLVLACKGSQAGGASVEASTGDAATTDALAPSASASASSSASASASASAAPPRPPPSRHVSIAGVLLVGARDQPLTDEQQATLQKIEAGLYPHGSPSTPWMAVRAFELDLAAGVRANKLDKTKLHADEAAVDKAVAAGESAEADALDALHAALDADARQALVDAVRTRRATFDKPTPIPKALLTGVDGGPPEWVTHSLHRITRELHLDEDQQPKVRALIQREPTWDTPAAVLARRDALRKRIEILLTEFPKDTFSAHKLDLSGPAGHSPHQALSDAEAFASALLPILADGQNYLFSDEVRNGASRPERYLDDVDNNPPGPPGAHGPR